MTTARQRYVRALRQTGQIIQTSAVPDFEVTMRGVVMLAMFEVCVCDPFLAFSRCVILTPAQVVKGTHKGIAQVHAHVMGGIAILRRWCPMPEAAFRGIRAMVQMCFSLVRPMRLEISQGKSRLITGQFIPAHISGTAIPSPLREWVEFSSSLLDLADLPAHGLGQLVADFLQVSAYVQTHILIDGRPMTTSTLRKLIELDAEFVKWEQSLDGVWLYKTVKAKHLSPAAIFDGEYHIYYDMWAARMWAHYRWARILINQTIVEFVNNSPISSLSLVSAKDLEHRLHLIQTIARDVLVSTPSHWRHPHLEEKVSVIQSGGAGSGSAGLPVVLFQLKVATSAPGVPERYWEWAYSVMGSMWSDLGMLHAKSMMEAMRAYRDSLQRAQANGILTHS